ncbi:ELWxxDGT repeat protein [Methylobacterium sp. A54F]
MVIGISQTYVFPAFDGTKTQLWLTDGTPEGTRAAVDLPSGNGANDLTALGDGRVAFSFNDGQTGSELWITDGTQGGTRRVADINLGTNGALPLGITRLGTGKVVFSAEESGGGRELWISDGTADGTRRVKDIYPGTPGSQPEEFTALPDGRLVFRAADQAGGQELWVTDGTEAGTTRVKDIYPGPSDSRPGLGGGSDRGGFARLADGRLIFGAQSDAGGSDPWITDGTAEGTQRLIDLLPGGISSADSFTALGDGRVIFAANGDAAGYELWITDGTAAGTRRVRDINPGSESSNPRFLTALGDGHLVFNATDAVNAGGLWVTDGTEGGTTRISDVSIGVALYSNAPDQRYMTAIGGGRAVFAGAGAGTGYDVEPYITDGTAAGTTRLGDLSASGSSYPIHITAIDGGRALFQASDGSGNEPWVTDGTPAGTRRLADINPRGASNTSDFTPIGPVAAPATLSLSPATDSRSEGAQGGTAFTYTVTRGGDLSGTATVDVVVSAGNGANPAQGADFVGGSFPTRSLTFGPGETQKSFTFPILNDSVAEPDETFAVTLANATGATVVAGTATGTILNDDGAPATGNGSGNRGGNGGATGDAAGGLGASLVPTTGSPQAGGNGTAADHPSGGGGGSAGEGAGGAGAAASNAAAGAFASGAGGRGGAHGSTSRTNEAATTGTAGQDGFAPTGEPGAFPRDNAGGGGGGEGGYGLLLKGSLDDFTNTVDRTGGNGGAGGDGLKGGDGGDGGIGLAALGSRFTLRNGAVISGGRGGTAGGSNYDTGLGSAGRGGSGLTGHDLTVINSGTIRGGLAGALPGGGQVGSQAGSQAGNQAMLSAAVSTAAQADAVTFTGGTNRLELSNGTVDGTLEGGIGVSGTLTLVNGRFPSLITGQAREIALDNVIHDGPNGAGAIVIDGSGPLRLTGISTYTGPTTLRNSTLFVDGAIASGVNARDANLLGDGSILGSVATDNIAFSANPAGAGLGDAVGSLYVGGDLTLDRLSDFREDVAGAASFDVVTVAGRVSLGGAGLVLNLLPGAGGSAGQSITLIDNLGTDSVEGSFQIGGQTAAEGMIASYGGRSYRLSYKGGDGNDVTITDVTGADTGTGTGTPGGGTTGGGTTGGSTGGGTTGGDGGGGPSGGSTPPGPTPFDDDLVGTDGSDEISLLGGDDRYLALQGDDLVFGNTGNDTIFGNQGRDTAFGGQGNDTLYGGQGDDRLSGDLGDDLVFGNLGSDALFGGKGADTLYGGQGSDTLYGGQGADTLYGDLGDDVLSGDLGADRFVFGRNSGRDLILGFSQADGDRLDLQGQTYTVGTAANGDAELLLSGGGTVRLAGIDGSTFGTGAGYLA